VGFKIGFGSVERLEEADGIRKSRGGTRTSAEEMDQSDHGEDRGDGGSEEAEEAEIEKETKHKYAADRRGRGWLPGPPLKGYLMRRFSFDP
jgi:hypothetical protein